MNHIPFNQIYKKGNELIYINQVIESSHVSGNGPFTKKCQKFFEERYKVKKVLLTTSCTDALEMAAILTDIGPGDEVILPSFTFVSTANAFVLRGAKLVFVDSMKEHPNMDASLIEELISSKTKVIVPVHYAGVPCDMDRIMELAKKYNLFVVEDAAQAIESSYKGKQLGTIGHLGTFSFHESKNITCGEGGALLINDERFINRAEIIWEKGTNRSAFFRGEINKYGWVDIGSSFLPSDILAAFLYAQLEKIEEIQHKRGAIWDYYFENINENSIFKKLDIEFKGSSHNFVLKFNNLGNRDNFLGELRRKGIHCTFHFLPLEKSEYFEKNNLVNSCPYSSNFSDAIVRLPLYAGLSFEQLKYIVEMVNRFEQGKDIHLNP